MTREERLKVTVETLEEVATRLRAQLDGEMDEGALSTSFFQLKLARAYLEGVINVKGDVAEPPSPALSARKPESPPPEPPAWLREKRRPHRPRTRSQALLKPARPETVERLEELHLW